MSRYAFIKANKVVNVIIADAAFVATNTPSDCTAQLVPDDSPASIGWTHNGGASFTEPVPEVIVPQYVSMRQARLALLGAGMLSAVTAAINALPSPQKEAAQIEWEYSQEVFRFKPLVLALAPALGLSSAQLDSLFVAAAQL